MGVETRLQGAPRKLTKLETVDAQAGVGGGVQPPLFSPATGGVCVHLPCCHPCRITTRFQLSTASRNTGKLYRLCYAGIIKALC